MADSNLIATIAAYETVVPFLEVWGVNAYRGSTFGSLFNDFQTVSGKPLVILEYGIDAYNAAERDEY